jgi:hypothetical protein
MNKPGGRILLLYVEYKGRMRPLSFLILRPCSAL